MTATGQIRGHKIYYDYDAREWKYCDNHKSMNSEIRPCVDCKHLPVDDKDYCLRNIEVISACCGHGVDKGYIKLKDGRIFREAEQ